MAATVRVAPTSTRHHTSAQAAPLEEVHMGPRRLLGPSGLAAESSVWAIEEGVARKEVREEVAEVASCSKQVETCTLNRVQS